MYESDYLCIDNGISGNMEIYPRMKIYPYMNAVETIIHFFRDKMSVFGRDILSVTVFLSVAFLAVSCSSGLKESYSCSQQKREARELIRRTIGNRDEAFDIRIGEPREDGKDWFSLYGENGRIVLEGNNGISVSSAFKAWLEDCCHCQVSWCGDNLTLPESLPIPTEKVTRVSPYKYRYYLNYCTFNYTMSWWQETRWQKEIDFMAMNGINAPLAVTGQSSVWQRVYNRLGLSTEDLESFFCAPTHFSWFWMGNLDGWGGPLPQSFIDRHEKLQKFILEKERRLGMTPILPAFTGHIPPAFAEKYPQAKIRHTSWEGFAPVSILDPEDSLFTVIGKMFMEEQTRTYGTNHLYSADTFNENTPPTHDSLYLSGMGRKVYESMAEYDPKAVWVMQGWLFYYNGAFWKEPEIRALFSGVPDDKMLILDLWSERVPVWNRTNGYYGKPWVWCMLHNFGQNPDFNGNVANVASGPSAALADPRGEKMMGLGVTMEGIEQMPSIYALMFENIWKDESTDISEFMGRYLRNRYGEDYSHTEKAWERLNRSVFDQSVSGGCVPSVVTGRPSLSVWGNRISERHINKYVKPLNSAWRELIGASKEFTSLCCHDGFRYDLVDVTRQVLTEYANTIHVAMCLAYDSGDIAGFKSEALNLLGLMKDLDALLATRKEFLLGRWIDDARAYGSNESESDKFEQNARNLVTLWGDKDCGIHDYAYRHWAGLVSGFYAPRWQRLIDSVTKTAEHGEKFNPETFGKSIREWEWQWTFGKEKYTTEPYGDEIEVCQRVFDKYSNNLLYEEE